MRIFTLLFAFILLGNTLAAHTMWDDERAYNQRIHVVQPKETLYKISRQHGVSITAIRKNNNITGDIISAGARLKISIPAENDIFQVHIVRVDESLEGADVVLYIAEVGEKEIPAESLSRLQKGNVPVVLALNKVDTISQEEVAQKTEHWKSLFNFSSIVPISALNKFNTLALLAELVNYLPVCPPYYPKDQLTDKPEKFFAAEILREKIFFRYKKEIPYSTEVVIEWFKDEPELLRIGAVIMVERESQKGIMIGEKGAALKNTGTAARKEMENFFGKKVFLEMYVKVKEKWRDDKRMLKDFGYEE